MFVSINDNPAALNNNVLNFGEHVVLITVTGLISSAFYGKPHFFQITILLYIFNVELIMSYGCLTPSSKEMPAIFASEFNIITFFSQLT